MRLLLIENEKRKVETGKLEEVKVDKGGQGVQRFTLKLNLEDACSLNLDTWTGYQMKLQENNTFLLCKFSNMMHM